MVEKKTTLVNKLGMHARAATKLVQIAQKFKSKITVIVDGMEADAKSILGLLILAAPMGTKVIIRAEGEDEEEAVEAIIKLIEDKFGEEE